MKQIYFLFLFTISSLLVQGQQMDDSTFDKHLNELDRLAAFETNEACIEYADSLISNSKLTAYQINLLNITKGFKYIIAKQDSLAMTLLSKGREYLFQQKDTTSIAYADLLEGLGRLQKNKYNNEKALAYYHQSKEIRAKLLGEEHIDYARSLSDIAVVYLEQNQFDKAFELLKEGNKIFEKLYGDNNPYYASDANNLAFFYSNTGSYEKAEQLYKEVVEIREKKFGKEADSYLRSLNNLANFYKKIKQFQKAESLYLELKETSARVYGKEYQYYISSIAGLGFTHFSLGQYEKSETLLLEAKNLQEKKYGKENNKYGRILNNLGLLYMEVRQYEKAEEALLESVNIFEKIVGKKNGEYAGTLANLAKIYRILGMKNRDDAQFEKSEALFLEAIKIRENIFGKDNIALTTEQNNLGALYYFMGEYEKSVNLFTQALRIKEKVLGENHPSCEIIAHNVTKISYKMKDYEKATEYALSHGKKTTQLLKNNFSFLSEKSKQQYHDRRVGNFDLMKSIAIDYTSNLLREEIYNTLLFEKGLHLESSIQTKKFIFSQNDISLNKKYEDLITLKKELQAQYKLATGERNGLEDLEQKIENIERELAKASSAFRQEQASNKVDRSAVQINLETDAIAIEFTSFNRGIFANTDSIIYAASVLIPDGTTHFIPLCSEKELSNKLINDKNTSNSIATIYDAEVNEDINLIVSRGARDTEGFVKDKKANRSLYEMLWQPLDSLLQGKQKIYYAPAGLLNRLNMNAILIDDKKVLGDQYELINLMSTRSIAAPQVLENNNIAYTVGGVEYDFNPNTAIDIASMIDSSALSFTMTDRSLRGGEWDYLKWTATEAETINQKLSTAGYTVNYRTQQSATEEDFKTLGTTEQSPRIIHLATHGYFFPDTKKVTGNAFQQADHPLLRSGVILASANHVWKGEEAIPDKEDGILTAYEISNMNLSNTELVVLSACETGLGDIQGGEGVYGLQRAFKMAGAKYIIMSLWQVPDQATSVFMTQFYENWLDQKMSIRQAFNKAQLQMRDQFGDHHMWAGFVLIE